MNEIDKERKEEFKEYEMKKKAEEDHKLAQMNEEANYLTDNYELKCLGETKSPP